MGDTKTRLANASILVYKDGELRPDGTYGVAIEEGGGIPWCSERQAGLAPEGPTAWLLARYPHLTFELRNDGGEAYYDALRRALGLEE